MAEDIILEKETYKAVITQDKSEALVVAFRRKRDSEGLTEEERQEIRNDLKDLGKWRELKKLKKDLEGIGESKV